MTCANARADVAGTEPGRPEHFEAALSIRLATGDERNLAEDLHLT